MKKRFKLKGELIVFIIIAMILSYILGMLGFNIYSMIFKTQERLNQLSVEKSNDELKRIESYLNIESKDENIVKDKINNISNKLNDKSYICLTDNNGYIIDSNMDLIVRQIDLNNEEYEKLNINGAVFTSQKIIKLNDRFYVVIILKGYSDGDFRTIICWFVPFLIIFILLIKGRVKYINSIAKNVRIIAKGDFSKRVDIKYKNELTSLAKDINYMAEEIMNQDSSQKEFITNISHDLRTPLTVILGYSNMIEEKKYSSEEELQRYVSIINRKGKYLKTLLDDFFQYSKLSSKDIKMNKELINLNEIIMQILDEEEIYFKEKGFNLKANLENKSLYTYGDSMLLKRAFENLINNALKYSKEKSIIEINLKNEIINKENYGVFSIYNVPKINLVQEDIDKFFKRLYKMDSSRYEKGSGLGLAISQEIVKNHNGFIKVNKVKNGLEFSIGLKESR